MELTTPTEAQLPSYLEALSRRWSSNTMRSVVEEELASIREDPALFLARQTDREARGPKIQLADGQLVDRLPGFTMWMWDGEFCGSINLRWASGTSALPPHVLGHIGYSVVPWKQRLGYASSALGQLLPLAKAEGLDYVELTTDEDNIASQRVIERNGGVLLERFDFPNDYSDLEGLRYRISL